VAYPGERVGYQAASLLSGMMHGAGVDDDYVMPIPIHELVARESTNTLAVDDPIVADAVHHIRSQAAVYPIRVSEIVARSRLSHSGFNKNFFRQMGHTPKEEIKRVRLLHLQALLKNTGTRISQIARKMRFESPEELTRFFKRETGFAPKDYRKHYHPTLH
jgi:LacI family transcriptional regulator